MARGARGVRPAAVGLAVFTAISLVLLVGLHRMMTNAPADGARTWTARFESVSGLRPGDDVRVAGVDVGRVDDIEVVDGDLARVRFTMDGDLDVHERTRVTLRYQNLLGQRYLALSAPGADRGARLPAGAEIPLSRTSPGFDLTALLNGFEPLFSVLEPAEVNELAGSIVAVLQGESGTVESLLRGTAEATSYLADRDEVFGEVLANLTPVLQNLDEQSEDVDATVVALRRLMQGLAGERRTFGRSLDNLAGLVDSTSGLLRELRPGLRRDVAALREVSGLLADERDRVGHAVERLPRLFDTFARTMSYGGFLNVYLCNLGVDLAEQTVWVPASGGPYSGACR
ncbi:MCE family protein [Nocardioides sp. zg-579]|uniref:MCE family protein n=1 Tax=Nocardioides marmotae TaxID=2663857 RepID=A0A6I3J1B3_9ACTN|nr:MlaD family protein [Nocardioides marmotae]MCR6031172.1 MCE family protein [Gordonia jinghuaiqii]MTB94811.1 MCE family protein [Nocardioides marmotae]QKE01200.1 MCE family protein [Nocardioides marmotae]